MSNHIPPANLNHGATGWFRPRRDFRLSEMIIHARRHGVDSILQAEHGNGLVVRGIEQRRAVVSKV